MSNGRPRTIVVDEPVFSFVVELEIQKALRLQYPICVVTISAEGGPEPWTLVGDANFLAGVVTRLIRAADLIGLVDKHSAVLRLLLVGAYLDDAIAVIDRIRNDVPAEVPLRFGVACFPGTDASVEALLTRADREVGIVETE